jgi:hypothetical protein
VGVTGIAATILLHSFFFAAAVWGGGGQRESLARPPDAMGGGANSGREDGELGERRITVMLTPQFQSALATEPPSLVAEPVIVKPSIVEIADLDALPLPPIQMDPSGEDAADQEAEMMARVKFAGIYQSQIRARIVRAWELPNGHESESDFSCLVLIHQNQDGRVISVEIDLAHCEGSPAMRASLVHAINVASPLPAPPHPSVFVDRFSLILEASAARQPDAVARN